jgi:hypothetical protein
MLIASLSGRVAPKLKKSPSVIRDARWIDIAISTKTQSLFRILEGRLWRPSQFIYPSLSSPSFILPFLY